MGSPRPQRRLLSEQGWTISDDLQSIWIVFDALVHVSECRHKSASTAVGEQVTETTGISP